MSAENSTAAPVLRTREAGAATAYGPFGRMYAGRFFISILLQVFAVMVLVEAVFLAERFPMVFRDALANNANLVDTAEVFLLNSTQIFDLALAIAILMAVYWTMMRMRESRELLVLFGGGAGPVQLVVLVLAIALGAQLASITVSGALDPMSRYTQRQILFDAEFRAMRNGINTGQFYYFPERVAFAPVQTKALPSGQTRKLFLYQQIDPDTFRVVTADHARLIGPNAAGKIQLLMEDVTSRTFAAVDRPDAPPLPVKKTWFGDDYHMTLSASSVVQRMTMDDLLTFLPRGDKVEELTFAEQLVGIGITDKNRRDAMKLLGERFSRSLLCLLAPLIAMAFVCMTTRRTSFVALPVACMALMALNVASEWLIGRLVPEDPLGAMLVPGVITLTIVGLLFLHIHRQQGALVRPQLGRP